MAQDDKVYHVHSLNDLPDAASWLLQQAGSHRLLAFHGEMGAGKTTLIQAICRHLGVAGEVTSPTFALVNEYSSAAGEPVYHFDFYRIDDPHEALDFGLDEYLYSGSYCLMEWPEKVNDLLPDDVLWLFINEQDDGSREFVLRFPQ